MTLRDLWRLDPAVTFLNHGSYGACPAAVLDYQAELRARLERQPVQFLGRDLQPLLMEARATLATFLGAETADIAFVTNATTGVNTVLRSLEFAPGDELLVTDHVYKACFNALEYVAGRAGATVVVAPTPFPVANDDEIVAAIVDRVTPNTRIALVDHISSPTALIFPIARIVSELAARGVDTVVDGAHAPGMVPLDLTALGAAYYTGNGHKWLCAPKGAAFLYVRRDRQERIRPLTISHGADAPLGGNSRFEVEFAWQGTHDPTAVLSLAESVRYLPTLVPGGWDEIRRRNHELAVAGRRLILDRLGMASPCPEDMLGSIASIPLPGIPKGDAGNIRRTGDLQAALLSEFGVEVPIFGWAAPIHHMVRISAQLYNSPDQYERLADGLLALLARE
ncbi:penicillin epimerase [bacterium SCGC AG-212-C10]|nr:penicillin epimerase [bacterium SCGC AG-212-C10]